MVTGRLYFSLNDPLITGPDICVGFPFASFGDVTLSRWPLNPFFFFFFRNFLTPSLLQKLLTS